MNPIINRILENNLNDLKGLSIEGEIPFTEEFLNEMAGIFLATKRSQPVTGQEKPEFSSTGFDISQLLNALDEKEFKIELKEKLAVLKINAKKF